MYLSEKERSETLLSVLILLSFLNEKNTTNKNTAAKKTPRIM
jgi:hypothetical protein